MCRALRELYESVNMLQFNVPDRSDFVLVWVGTNLIHVLVRNRMERVIDKGQRESQNFKHLLKFDITASVFVLQIVQGGISERLETQLGAALRAGLWHKCPNTLAQIEG